MSSVESRIVTMKFDNTAFQKGVSSTMDALSKLKTAVSGMGDFASKGFSAIGSAASKANLAPLGAQADEVGNRFTAMSVVAITALATIAHTALQTGYNFAKSFTFGPIMDGLSEYQTNLQSIQTIQANTDRPLTEITASLDELNRYSDRTIYNFSEMAKNIGTFTAAGVDLKTATSAIKGIANMAALSGSTSAQASSAMYQLSQALASGKVSLMDWNSVVNAGMGGKKLQTALANTAVAMGTLEKNAISGTDAMDTLKISGQSFRESISANADGNGWLTSDVLKNTLASLDGRFSKLALETEKLEDGTLKYAKAGQVAAAIDREREKLAKQGIVYNDAQWESLLKLSDSSFLAATQVKTLSQVMQVAKETLASGWSATFRNIFGDFGEAKKTFTDLSSFINDGINAMALRRNNMLAKWNEMGGRDVLIESFKNAFKALSHVIQPIQRAFRDIFPRTTAKNLFAITEAVERFTSSLVMQGSTMHDVRAIFKAVFGVIAVGIEIVKGVFRYFTSLIGLLSGGTGGMLDFSGSIAEIVSGLTDWILKGDYIAKFFDKIIAGREALLGPIIDKFGDLMKVLAGFVRLGAEKAIEGISKALEFITPILTTVVDWLVKAGGAVQDNLVAGFKALEPVVQVIYEWLQAVGTVVEEKLISAFDKLVPVFDRIKSAIADAFGSLSGVGGAVGGAFSGLASMFDIGDATKKASNGIDTVKEALFGIESPASGAQNALSSFWEWLKGVGEAALNFGKSLGGVLASIGQAIYAEISGIFKGGAEYGGAIASFLGGIVSSMVDAVSGMSFNEFLVKLNALLATGIVASVMRMLFQIGGIFKDARGVFRSLGGVLDQATSGIKTMQNSVRAQMLLNIAIAVGILAAALWVLSKIPQEKLGLALGAVTAMLLTLTGALVVLTKTMPGVGLVKDAVKMGALTGVLIALGVAMLLMAGAVYLFSRMDAQELQKGLLAVGIVLAGITGAAFALERSGGSGALLRASFAIGIMAVSLAALAATIKLFSALDTGMLLEGGAKIAALLIGLGIAMQFLPAQNVIAGAIALGIVAVAMVVMVKALKQLAKLSAGDSIQTVLTLAAVLAILIAAMNAATAAMPGALALVVVSGALVILSKALEILGNMSLWEIIKALLALVGVFVVLGLAAVVLAPVIPLIILLGAAIAILGIGMLAAGTGVYLFGAGLQFLAESGSKAVSVLIDSINQFLDAIPGFFDRLTKAIPAIGRLFRKIISEGLKTLRAAIPDMIKTGFDILMAFLRGIRNNLSQIISVSADILVKLVKGLGDNAWRIIKAALEALLKFLDGIERGIRKYSDKFVAAGKGIADALIDAITNAIADGYGAVRDALISMVARAAVGIAAGIINDITGQIQSEAGSVTLPSSLQPSTPPSTQGPVDRPIVNDLDSKSVPQRAEKSASNVLDVFKKTLGNLSDVVSSNLETSPSITPVLDLTQVQKDASQIGAMLGSTPLSTDVSYQQASSISSEQMALAEQAASVSGGEGVTEIKFEQHNNSPKALSPVEIFRNTKSQLSLAKEALKV